jgi:hypothetical protein
VAFLFNKVPSKIMAKSSITEDKLNQDRQFAIQEIDKMHEALKSGDYTRAEHHKRIVDECIDEIVTMERNAGED